MQEREGGVSRGRFEIWQYKSQQVCRYSQRNAGCWGLVEAARTLRAADPVQFPPQNLFL
jgi:hypothetical protein